MGRLTGFSSEIWFESLMALGQPMVRGKEPGTWGLALILPEQALRLAGSVRTSCQDIVPAEVPATCI